MSDFSELQVFIERWGLASASERLQQRVDSDLSELEEFYKAVSPQLEAIIEYLNQFPVDAIPEKDRSLACMALAICEVDDALHVWKASNLDYISDPCRWRTKSTFSDYR